MIEHFFSEHGLTSTSANHIANMAKEYIDSQKNKLSHLRFYNEVTNAGGNCYNTAACSTNEEFQNIKGYLQEISRATQLIAWLREALKYKDSLEPMNFDEWCTENKIVIPPKPVKKATITREEIINSWDIAKYNSYFSHQTNASVIGTFIHPKGTYSDAREDLNEAINNPTQVLGQGRDITVIQRHPAYTIEEVDNLFFELQKMQREEQSLYNKLDYEIQTAIENDSIEKLESYRKESQTWTSNYDNIYTRYCTYNAEETKRLKNLKIAIPASLKDIYAIIQNLGK